MGKVKTSELEGAALDWAVAMSVGEHVGMDSEWCIGILYSPSRNWSQGGSLIDRFKVSIYQYPDGEITADCNDPNYAKGPTALIAACRAIVAAKLGDVVDVPDSLMQP